MNIIINFKWALSLFVCAFLISSTSYAERNDGNERAKVNTNKAPSSSTPFPDFSDLPSANSPLVYSSSHSKIRLKLDCYGANVRSVSNPLHVTNLASKNAKVEVNVKTAGGHLKVKIPNLFFIKGNTELPFSSDLSSSDLTYSFQPTGGASTAPADPAQTGSITGSSPIKLDTQESTANEIVLYASTNDIFPNLSGHENCETVNSKKVCKNLKNNQKAFKVTKVIQSGVVDEQGVRKQYVGTNGVLSSKIKSPMIEKDNGKTVITQLITVPAGIVKGTKQRARSICGSFFSPIMLSFSNQAPKFKTKVEFPIHPVFSKTYWPSTYNQNYFLAIDTNGDGKITNETEIFGDRLGEFKNGFEALAKLDSNKDGLINRKDKMFSKLLLWQDTNKNGVGEKKEVTSLSQMKVTWISLKYKDANIRYKNAAAKQISSFSYTDKKGKSKLGEAIDYWFKPAGGLKITRKVASQ